MNKARQRAFFKNMGKNVTAVEKEDLLGPVKQVMETIYKAHLHAGNVIQGKIEVESVHDTNNLIFTFNEKGVKIQEQLFGYEEVEINNYDDNGRHSTGSTYKKGALYQSKTYEHNQQGKMTAYAVHKADGSLVYRGETTYTDDGKPLVSQTYSGIEEILTNRTVYAYDERGNYISCLQYEKDNKLRHRSYRKYNELNQEIESTSESLDENMAKYNSRTISRYNQQGDVVEQIVYDGEGKIKNTYTHNPQYDSEGKRIVEKREDPYAPAKGETEELENDTHGNWIKKTTFYNKVPVNIYTRVIIYFDDASANEATLVHPLTLIKDETETEKAREEREELSEEEAKWITEGTQQPDTFPAMRYYSLKFKEVPSVITYTGPNIEARALLKELKENMLAEEIHSSSSIWNSHQEQLSRYTLAFRGRPYLLHALGIGTHNTDEFDIPDSLKAVERYGRVYTSSFQLLRPSEASGKRDRYFENELEEYIQLCSLDKKPDKPTIHIVEVRGNNFAMVEHAVSDDFEIKDLNVHYGYGFDRFDAELMQRFQTEKKGLVLFHGLPGTGKTYYIRHLLRKMTSLNNKVVIYMPPNMVDHLTEPNFMTFLADEVKNWSEDGFFCVLLIEDAEPLLAKRQEGVRIQGVTNLLNMSDGLLNDMLNLQIICTFNVDLKKLDSALLRPGRLLARKEFKALGVLDANLLAQRLGIKHHFKKSATLSEIYAMRKDKNTLIHDVEPDQDASTILDDL